MFQNGLNFDSHLGDFKGKKIPFPIMIFDFKLRRKKGKETKI